MLSRTAGAELQRLKRIDRVCERIEEGWKRGEAKWVRDPKCIGVWGYGEGKLFTMLAGKRQDRGKEAVAKGVPALEALCGSLTKGDVEAVNGLAFLVKPKG